MEVVTNNNKKVFLSAQSKKHILSKHPETKNLEKEIEETLKKPDEIRRSKSVFNVLIYYKFYGSLNNYIAVVVKVFNGEGAILTCYITGRIKIGEKI